MAYVSADAPADAPAGTAAPDNVWNNGGNGDIQSFFQNPPWIAADERAATGQSWYDCMASYGIFLFDTPSQPNTVPDNGVAIYDKLFSGEMPQDDSGKWPAANLEQFRLWYNDGCRVLPGSPTPGPHGVGHIPAPSSS